MTATAIDERTTVDLAELCEWLGGETPEQLKSLIEAGIIRPNDDDGQFPLMMSISNYISFWRSIADAADAQKIERRAG